MIPLNRLSLTRLNSPALRLLRWVDYASPGSTTITASTLEIDGAGICTLLWKGTFSAVATGTAQRLIAVDAGSAASSFYVRQVAGSSALQLLRANAGAVAASLGTASVGPTFKIGMSVLGTGEARASLDSAAPVSVTGGITSGVASVILNENFSGTCTIVRVLADIALSDAALQSALQTL